MGGLAIRHQPQERPTEVDGAPASGRDDAAQSKQADTPRATTDRVESPSRRVGVQGKGVTGVTLQRYPSLVKSDGSSSNTQRVLREVFFTEDSEAPRLLDESAAHPCREPLSIGSSFRPHPEHTTVVVSITHRPTVYRMRYVPSARPQSLRLSYPFEQGHVLLQGSALMFATTSIMKFHKNQSFRYSRCHDEQTNQGQAVVT